MSVAWDLTIGFFRRILSCEWEYRQKYVNR
jgi:hypothetical protein